MFLGKEHVIRILYHLVLDLLGELADLLDGQVVLHLWGKFHGNLTNN